MIAEFISTHEPAWTRFIERNRHDVYHLPEYIELAARHEGEVPGAFICRHHDVVLVVPVLLRDLPAEIVGPSGGLDVTSPYGYPSPLSASCPNVADLDSAFQAIADLARSMGIVTGFFRLNPMLDLPLVSLANHGRLVFHGETVFIDLTRSTDVIWSGTRERFRTDIRRLNREGYRATLADVSLLPQFIRAYRSTMERVNASDFYFFSDEYFFDLERTLGERLKLIVVHGPDDGIACGGLFTVESGIVQYHLGGTAPDHLRRAPSKLMFNFAREWAADTGQRILHLGGGVGGSNDSLFQFKAGFSADRGTFHTLRMVFNPERNESLSRATYAKRGGPPPSDAFFPAYRN